VTTAGLPALNMTPHISRTRISSGQHTWLRRSQGRRAAAHLRLRRSPILHSPTRPARRHHAVERIPSSASPGVELAAKQATTAYLLHIIRSMKGSGKAACIRPTCVLFREMPTATIARQALSARAIQGTSPACKTSFTALAYGLHCLWLDKENAGPAKGVFMIDASKGFHSRGPKNRLPRQTPPASVELSPRQADGPALRRMVPLAEIANPKTTFNLNLPRYIDAPSQRTSRTSMAICAAAFRERDSNALSAFWKVLPAVRAVLSVCAAHRLRAPESYRRDC